MTAHDEQFARDICRVLRHSVRDLPTATADRLAASRREALTRRRRAPEYRGTSLSLVHGMRGYMSSGPVWGRRLALAMPFVIFAFCFNALYQDVQAKRIAYFAEIDIGVLSDTLPLTAYIDPGFSRFLEKGVVD